MLTAHNYEDVKENWNADIKECCKTKPPGQTGCTDCCYDGWQDELNLVSARYNDAAEDAQQKQNLFNFLTARRDKYKSWLTELDKADIQARDICSQLKMIAVQTDRIWYNSNKAVQAIEILFCMIREIMLASDDLKTTCINLDNCITKCTDPLITGGQGILIYYKDYKTKMDATVKSREEIIKNIMEAVSIAYLIANAVSTRLVATEPAYVPCNSTYAPCDKLPEIVYGFKTIICEWYKYFGCDCPPCDQTTSKPPTQNTAAIIKAQQATAKPVTNEPDDCATKCELTPTFEFPICEKTYRGCVQDWVEEDTSTLTKLEKELITAKIAAQGLQSCMTSLINAIKAVNPSERCK